MLLTAEVHKASTHNCPTKRNRVCIRPTSLLDPKIKLSEEEEERGDVKAVCGDDRCRYHFEAELWAFRIETFRGTVLKWEALSGEKWSFPVFSHGEMYAVSWGAFGESDYV